MAVAISQDEAMKALFSDRRVTLGTLLEIEDKNRQLVPLVPNPIQDDVISTSSNRDIYVKPGQIGFTSIIVGDFYIDNITVNGTVSVIISYDEFSAQRQVLKAKRYHKSLERKILDIPKLEHKSSTELSWEDKATGFYSTMYIFSSRSYTLGRGETIHNLLLDEYAFWAPGTHEAVFASAVQRVPLMLNTKIRIGSTANGEDNPFCEMYKAAKEGSEIALSVYKPHFYPWFIHPEYKMYPDSMFCLPGDSAEILPDIQPDEELFLRTLTDVYKLYPYEAMAKLRWRRYKKAEMASLRRTGDTVFIFEQEYPEDDETCFLTAGNQAYDPDAISIKLRQCYPAPIHRTVTNKRTGVSAGVDIWFDKEEGKPYLVSIDPGKGKASESVAHAWTFMEGYTKADNVEVPPVFRHCATLSGWYDEWEMAEYCKELGYYYNGATLAPEDNLDIVSHLRDYPDLYYREDTRSGKVGRVIGWQTNVSTKPYMLTELNRHLDYVECYDQRFWSQCRNIRRDPTAKYGISVVGADDHHDAGVIAIVCRGALPIERGYVGNTGDSGGWDDKWGR